MDVHDISGLEDTIRCIAEQKKNLRNALAFKGQRPTREPRNAMINQFLLSRASNTRASGLGGESQVYTMTSFVPPSYPPCITPFSELTKTTIDKLVLETQHRGKYLLVRVVTPQDRITAVMAIVEDEKREVVMLQLYHQEQAGDTLEDILTQGSVVLVKEPYLKHMANGGYGLRVDHVCDVEFLPPGDERIPDAWKQTPRQRTAVEWKIKGNEEFNATRYRAAIAA